MDLNSLKPAWRQFHLLNSMESMDKDEIKRIIDRAEDMCMDSNHRYAINAVIVTVLTICFQGG